jgi:hypothetical protein
MRAPDGGAVMTEGEVLAEFEAAVTDWKEGEWKSCMEFCEQCRSWLKLGDDEAVLVMCRSERGSCARERPDAHLRPDPEKQTTHEECQ